MKTLRLLVLLTALSHHLSAFDWPGGTLQVPVVFRGEETFAGWVPASPWGSTAFIQEPAVELRNAANQLLAVYPITGGSMDWYDAAQRSGTASFSVPAGTYSLTIREGRRHIRISGEGWSGFKLVLDSITEPVPPNSAPTVAWTIAPGGADHLQSYSVSAHGTDADGNLSQVNVWKNGQPFAFGGTGTGYESDSGNGTSDAGPQTVTFTAQAVDATGATSPTISHTVTIGAAPAQYSLTVLAGAGGIVTGGGTFTAGTWATVIASPDSVHDFAGWSGDIGGAANPQSILMDRDRSVRAIFSPQTFPLTTQASGGGVVTPGGSYPFGTWVTITANPDASHYFTGWTGDASGAAPAVAVLVDRAKLVQAQFATKTVQTITFTSPGNQGPGASFGLVASSSSGLPVTFTLVGGPATLAGSTLTITGSGTVTVEATQGGNAYTLPASPVTVTFNATANAVVRYLSPAKTILGTGRETAANYVLGNP
jgi:hypothetical protein